MASIWDRIGSGLERLAGVPPGLQSEIDRRAARQRGLLALGTSLLQAGGPQAEQRGTLANLGAGLQAAQAAGLGALEEQDFLRARRTERDVAAQRQNIMQQFTSGPRDDAALNDLFFKLVSVGDQKGASSVSEIIKSRGGAQGFRLEPVINPETGQIEVARIGASGDPEMLGVSPAPGTGPRLQSVQVMGPNGLPVRVNFNPATGEYTEPPGGAQRVFSAPTQGESQANFFFQQLSGLEPAFAPFNEEPPNNLEYAAAQNRFTRQVVSPEIQTLQQAAGMYADAYIRLTSGAAYGETEFRNAVAFVTPQPGDSREVLRLKKQARESLLRALNSQRGRAAYNSGQGGLTPTQVIGEDTVRRLTQKPDVLDRYIPRP